jgi:hypothetical protein
MCPKFMNFVGILKIQIGRVVEDFKLRIGFGSEMKIHSIESLI